MNPQDEGKHAGSIEHRQGEREAERQGGRTGERERAREKRTYSHRPTKRTKGKMQKRVRSLELEADYQERGGQAGLATGSEL